MAEEPWHACSPPNRGGDESTDEEIDHEPADAARRGLGAHVRPKADSEGERAPPPADADAARERFEARLRRKAESGGEPALTPADAARESFEARLRRKADENSEGRSAPPQPLSAAAAPTDALPSADAARERFEARLRQKADSAAAAPAAANNVDSVQGNEDCEAAASGDGVADEAKGALEPEAPLNPTVAEGHRAATAIHTFPTDFATSNSHLNEEREDNAQAGGEIVLGRFHEALNDLLHMERAHGNLSELSSDPRVVRFIHSLSNLDGNADENRSQSHPISREITRESNSESGDDDDASRQGGEVDRGGTWSQSQQRGGQAWRSLTASVTAVRSFVYGLPRNLRGSSSFYVVRATLVEEEQAEGGGEVYMAERVGFWDRKTKRLACMVCALVGFVVVGLSLFFTGVVGIRGGTVAKDEQPSPSPTFDPRPTLEIVRDRGFVRCGFDDAILREGSLEVGLCRSIAAVVVGNPEKIEGVVVTGQNRWEMLHDRNVDVLLYGDTHTTERQTRERSTGVGFTFSSPYDYDGLVYSGKPAYVKCAEAQKRYEECSSLSICVQGGTIHYEFLRQRFPSEYIKITSSYPEMFELMQNGTCNAVLDDNSRIRTRLPFIKNSLDVDFVNGKGQFTKDPVAMVTRNSDREWSDILNWVLQAIIYAEEQGLTKDLTRCKIGTNLTLQGANDLDFMNAVYCVGSYGEQFDGSSGEEGMNHINNGTGMLYDLPFALGNFDRDDIPDPSSDSMLAKIMSRRSFNCGVAVPDGFEGNVVDSEGLIGMSVDYCRTLSAALFTGDSDQVNFTTLPETDDIAYATLANGTIDVLVGGKIQRKYDFGFPPLLRGLHYSTPYYFGNEAATDDVSFHSIATREGDTQFDAFVNMIVSATIYAQENGITKKSSQRMPLVSLFGPSLYWSLRDAIYFIGNYDEMYWDNFGPIVGVDPEQQLAIGEASIIARGRNTLNQGGPMLLSFPHLP